MSVRPENRSLLTGLLAVLVVTAAAGAYLFLSPSALPRSLPIPAGTVFTASETSVWVAHVFVGQAGGTLVGAWTAYNGSGFVDLAVVNGTVSKPAGGIVCPLVVIRWAERNGTVDVALGAGAYTVYWTTGYCSSAERILVTRTIQVVPA